MLVEQAYTSSRGRRRRRVIAVDVDAVRAELAEASDGDREDWERFRGALLAAVGEGRFAVWFDEIGLAGVDRDRRLVAAAPLGLRAWLVDRYDRVIAAAGQQVGRVVVIADEALTQALLDSTASVDASSDGASSSADVAAVGGPPGWSASERASARRRPVGPTLRSASASASASPSVAGGGRSRVGSRSESSSSSVRVKEVG